MGTVNLYQCGGSLIAPGVILTAASALASWMFAARILTSSLLHLPRSSTSQDPVRTDCESVPVWWIPHCSWSYPHCCTLRGQVQTKPHRVEDQVRGVGHSEPDRYVQALNIHPEFDGRNLQNDFAVLFTSEDAVLSSHIDTVCLPQADELFDGTTCFATGWGKDKFGSAGQYQVVLKEIDLPVVSNYECQDKLRSTRLGQKYKLHDSFICAGGVNGKDTCKGDGGSPL